MSRNLTPEPVATGSAETRIGQLRWREYGGPREAAGERTLLFVHGLLTNSDVWGEVVQNLSQDFRCITLDIPLGSHTIPAREDAALNVAELAQAVNEAAEQLCPHGFTLIGSDTGGVVSQLAAVQEPTGLKRLVLLSCDTEKNFLPLPLRYLQYVAYIPGTMQALRAALRATTPDERRSHLTHALAHCDPVFLDGRVDGRAVLADVLRDAGHEPEGLRGALEIERSRLSQHLRILTMGVSAPDPAACCQVSALAALLLRGPGGTGRRTRSPGRYSTTPLSEMLTSSRPRPP